MTIPAKVARIALLLILLLGVALAVYYREQFDVAALRGWVSEAGVWAPLVFMLVYALAAVLFLPGSVMTLAGGALFGPVFGTFYNLTGATLGAALAFLVARYLASDWVAARSGGRLAELIKGVEAEGWRFVAFTRLVPLFPFNLLNYALGLTKIPFVQYLLASYVCMLPGALAYTYLGYAGREAVAGGEGLISKGLLALALLAVVAFVPRLIKRLRLGPAVEVDSLRASLDAGEDVLVLDVRTVEEFTGGQGHIGLSTNIPLDTLKARLDEIAAYRDKPVVTVCRTDRRSAAAAELLAQAGFANVRVVRQGMTAWNRRGYPVES